MSELSDTSTKKPAVEGSPTDYRMMQGEPKKVVTAPSFSEELKNTTGNFFLFTMGAGARDEIDTQDGADSNKEADGYWSQQSFNSSNHVTKENGWSDQFGTVKTISTAANGMKDSSEFLAAASSGNHAGVTTTSATRPGMTKCDFEAEIDELSRQRNAARVSTSFKLLGTKM